MNATLTYSESSEFTSAFFTEILGNGGGHGSSLQSIYNNVSGIEILLKSVQLLMPKCMTAKRD